jgi:hypothetical protein
MKLGISYPVFHGEEFLEYTVRSIRNQVDWVGVVYQDLSFNSNPARPEMIEHLHRLKASGLIDCVAKYDPDFSLRYKVNEANARNVGLDCAIAAGCTHHITADVDEMYLPHQLEYVKKNFGDHDCCVAHCEGYYKKPTWKLVPPPDQLMPIIHTVNTRCDVNATFPVPQDDSRKMKTEKCWILRRDEFVVHHMSYVRKNLVEKIENTTHKYKSHAKFVEEFRKYNLGDRVRLAPDFLNRRTVLVENTFNIPEEVYDS